MTRPAKQIAASEEERLQLERLLNSGTLPVGQHVRIRIVHHCMGVKASPKRPLSTMSPRTRQAVGVTAASPWGLRACVICPTADGRVDMPGALRKAFCANRQSRRPPDTAVGTEPCSRRKRGIPDTRFGVFCAANAYRLPAGVRGA